jgi:hypothetical protein
MKPLPRPTPDTISASRKPSTISIVTEATTKTTVVRRFWKNSASRARRLKFSAGVNV